MSRRSLIEALAVAALSITALVAAPEPYALPATLLIIGAFVALSLGRAIREAREELRDMPAPPRRPLTRGDRAVLLLVALWLLPLTIGPAVVLLILLGFDHTSVEFWIAVAAIVVVVEALTWMLPNALSGGRKA